MKPRSPTSSACRSRSYWKMVGTAVLSGPLTETLGARVAVAREVVARHALPTERVLAARTPLIDKSPQVVKAVIKAMMVAQSQAEANIDAALKDTVGSYYKTTMEAAKMAAAKQPIMIDQRNNTQFILDRSQSMKELGYVKKLVPKGRSVSVMVMAPASTGITAISR